MDFKIKNRHRLKNKEIREIVEKLKSDFDSSFFSVDSIVETGFYENNQFLFINGKAYFMFYNNRIVFTLSGLNKYKPANKQVVVDMGAVKFVANGADVMSPGIVDADENIKLDDIVWICDEKNKKALAMGCALISGEDMLKKEKGKAVSIFHYVGDSIWDFVAKSL
jgi:PUA-domain protein